MQTTYLFTSLKSCTIEVREWISSCIPHSIMDVITYPVAKAQFCTSCGTLNLTPYFFCMMTSSNGHIFRVSGPLLGEFTGYRWIPLTKTSDPGGFDVFFDLDLSKRLTEPSRRWWFETPLCPLWHHSNAVHLTRENSHSMIYRIYPNTDTPPVTHFTNMD